MLTGYEAMRLKSSKRYRIAPNLQDLPDVQGDLENKIDAWLALRVWAIAWQLHTSLLGYEVLTLHALAALSDFLRNSSGCFQLRIPLQHVSA